MIPSGTRRGACAAAHSHPAIQDEVQDVTRHAARPRYRLRLRQNIAARVMRGGTMRRASRVAAYLSWIPCGSRGTHRGASPQTPRAAPKHRMMEQKCCWGAVCLRWRGIKYARIPMRTSSNLQALKILAFSPKGGKSLFYSRTHHLAGGGKCCCWPLIVGVRNGVNSFQAIRLSFIPMIHEC
jgi:hypothetical protein